MELQDRKQRSCSSSHQWLSHCFHKLWTALASSAPATPKTCEDRWNMWRWRPMNCFHNLILLHPLNIRLNVGSAVSCSSCHCILAAISYFSLTTTIVESFFPEYRFPRCILSNQSVHRSVYGHMMNQKLGMDSQEWRIPLENGIHSFNSSRWMPRLCMWDTPAHATSEVLLYFYLRGSCWIMALMSPSKSWRAFRHNLPTIFQTIDRHMAQDTAESCIAPHKVMPLLGCRIHGNTASSKQPEQSLHSTLALSVLDMARILQPSSSL